MHLSTRSGLAFPSGQYSESVAETDLPRTIRLLRAVGKRRRRSPARVRDGGRPEADFLRAAKGNIASHGSTSAQLDVVVLPGTGATSLQLAPGVFGQFRAGCAPLLTPGG